MFRLRLIDRFRFLIERQLSHGPFNQLLIVAAVIGLVSLVGGGLVLLSGIDNENLQESVWWAFLRLSDPGYLGDDEGIWRRIVSTALTIAGYVLFMGTLVAIMTQWLLRKMRLLEQGLTPVAYRGHVAVLGWSSRSLPLLKELLEQASLRGLKHRLKGKPIAVLADDITNGPLEQVQGDRQLRSKFRRLVLRSGSVLNPDHIDRVNVTEADTIVIPSSGHTGSLLTADAETVKTLASLRSRVLNSKRYPLVVAELQDSRKISIARQAYPGTLHVVASDIAVSRALARSLVTQGMSKVLNNLLVDPAGAQFYVLSISETALNKWSAVQSYLSHGIACGLYNTERGLNLNPSSGLPVKPGDRVIVLARSVPEFLSKPQRTTRVNQTEGELNATALRKTDSSGAGSKRVLMLGWNKRVPALVEEIAGYGDLRCDITSVSTTPIEDRQQEMNDRLTEKAYVSAPDIEFHQADYTYEHVLRQYEPSEYDVVLMFSSDRSLSGEEADARTIVGYLVLEKLLSKVDATPRVILELSDASNEAFVTAKNNEVLISSLMVSHVLAQIVMYPELRYVYDELLAASGADISIQHVADQLHGERSFAELKQRLAEEGLTLLGVQQAQQTRLAPQDSELFNCGSDTRLIMLV